MAPTGTPRVNCGSVNRGASLMGPMGEAQLHTAQTPIQAETRFMFRAVAGVVAAFLLLDGLPPARRLPQQRPCFAERAPPSARQVDAVAGPLDYVQDNMSFVCTLTSDRVRNET